MHQLHESLMFPTEASALASINKLIIDRVRIPATEWDEIIQEYSSDLNYLSIVLLNESGGRIRLLIEFGVQDDMHRKASGNLCAHWSQVRNTLEALISVTSDGSACDLSGFYAGIESYLSLNPSILETNTSEA